MSTVEAVLKAKSPQEAMLAIAAALDRIEQQEASAPSGWSADWGEPEAPKPSAVEFPDDLDGVNPAIREHIEDARRRLANETGASLEHDLPKGEAVTADVTDESTVVELPVPTEEDKEYRRIFARDSLQLEENFKQEGLVEAYAKGGPMWLYLSSSEGRDFILKLPREVRAAMIADIERFSPSDAYDFARDVMMARSGEEIGGTLTITQDAIDAYTARSGRA